jgi:two-component system, LytTR family, sensor kinase
MTGNFIFTLRFLRNYLLFTLVVLVAWFLPFHFSYGIDLIPALTDALFSVVMLHLVILALWFVVKFARSESISSTSSIRNSSIAALLLVSGWLFFTRFVLKTIFQADTVYIDFLMLAQPVRFIAGLFIAGVLYLSFYLNLYRQNAEELLKRENELKVRIQETRLQALKNQLNPHFIFNCLNSISSLTAYDPGKAREMLVLLSEFLRNALRHDISSLVTLDKEIASIELYLQIEKVRFEEKLNWEFRVWDETLKIQVPALILQPVFENAVKHGIQQSQAKGSIIMTCMEQNGYTMITVANSFDPGFSGYRGEGIGLENIRNRLALIYGKSDLLKVKASGGTFRVEIQIPSEPAPAFRPTE